MSKTIYECRKCKKTYSYVPLNCENCGAPFNEITFKILKNGKQLIFNRVEVKRICLDIVDRVINTLEQREKFDLSSWIEEAMNK